MLRLLVAGALFFFVVYAITDGAKHNQFGHSSWYCKRLANSKIWRSEAYNRTGYFFGSGKSCDLSCKEEAMLSGSIHADWDYKWDFDTTGPKGNSLSEQEERDYWDHYYINMTRWMARSNTPTGTYATVIVDARNLSHIWCKAVSRDKLKFQSVLEQYGQYSVANSLMPVSWIFHGEITAMWMCQEDVNALPQVDERTPNPLWGSAILYTNGEPCNQCFGSISYIGIHEIVFGASTMQIFCGRGRTQHGISNLELAEHAWMGGKDFIRVRGPLSPSQFESVRSLFPSEGLDRAIMSDFEDRRVNLTGESLRAFQYNCPPGYPEGGRLDV